MPWLAGCAALLSIILSAPPTRGDAPTSPRRPRVPPRRELRFEDPISQRGQHARGLYLGANFVRQQGADGVIAAVRETQMNAVVLDLKDAEGRIHYETAIPELASHRTNYLGDARELVQTLKAADIYVIARITCFADRSLPRDLPERAIQETRPRRGTIWRSWGTGGSWLDPYNAENHRMVATLAREAQELGFDEVQLDYVRFPVDDGTQFARYPSETRESRAAVLMRLLRLVDTEISIPLGVDVFGLAAYHSGDSSGLGQDLERWTRHVEVFTPMLYVNSMRAWRTGEDNRAFHLVYDGTSRLRRRVGPRPVIRPFLQAFSRGADQFDAGFIRAQVRAAREARADGFLFWHPGYSYGMVRRAMHNSGHRLLPFPIPDRILRQREEVRPPR